MRFLRAARVAMMTEKNNAYGNFGRAASCEVSTRKTETMKV